MKGQGKRFIRGLARENGPGEKGVGRERAGIVPPGLARLAPAPKIPVLNQAVHMPKASSPSETPASYEAALQELEQLVSQLESGQMPLEQLLTGYRRGAELLAFCKDRLQSVEDQIKVLDDGVLKPWTQE